MFGEYDVRVVSYEASPLSPLSQTVQVGEKPHFISSAIIVSLCFSLINYSVITHQKWAKVIEIYAWHFDLLEFGGRFVQIDEFLR